MPDWLKAKTLDLPRWVWVSMIVGGLGIGLYLRSKNDTSEPELVPESGPPNSGELVPPAAPIGSGGGGTSPVPMIPLPWKGPISLEPEPPGVELPESSPPPEAVAEQPHNPAPIVGQPIAAPHTPPVSENIAVAGPTSPQEKQKARNEVNRLQSEIDGLQNHIAQLTQAIQAHPKAQQRGQWDNERNADRTNIDGKRNEITWWNARA